MILFNITRIFRVQKNVAIINHILFFIIIIFVNCIYYDRKNSKNEAPNENKKNQVKFVILWNKSY